MALVNKYCVYAHVDEEGYCFYIGSGSMERAYDKNNRSPEWKEFHKENDYDIHILYRSSENREVRDLEILMTKLYKDFDHCHINKTVGQIPSDETKKLMSEANS